MCHHFVQSSADVYTDVTMPSVTGQPYLENLIYVDKHPQPSGDGPTGSLPTSLADFYGKMSLENARIIVQYHETGDAHIAFYDFGANKLMFSIGRINEDGNYGPTGGNMNSWKAYNRPYLQYSLEDLWAGK